MIRLDDGREYDSGFILNASYAGTNQILKLAGYEMFGIKYELCEIILCTVNENLKSRGFTVMDGPFFSIMPFGKSGMHSLTSVTFTPHTTSYDSVPVFPVREKMAAIVRRHTWGTAMIVLQNRQRLFPIWRALRKSIFVKNMALSIKILYFR